MSIILVLLFLVALIALAWNLSSHLPCPTWLGWLVERDNPFTKTNRASVIIEHLSLEPGMTVLDAGCGPGRLTIPLAKAIGVNGKVTALDLQQGMLQRVEEKARSEGLHNIQYVHAGIGEGKLNHSQYDRALLVTVLGEIPDRSRALKELFDALKPGGLLSVTEVIFDPHFQRQSTVLQLMQQQGFQKKTTFGNRFAYTMLFEKP
ncbi:MAG: methyltransferase domain-containing protein [Parachlamydia sp.]|nr:methyltransferase domain-containing protein [Parachlamydia sp.]